MSSSSTPDRVLHFAEALACVLDQAAKLHRGAEAEYLPLSQAHGRVLAADLLAPRDQPPFARSTRDGYALYSGDLTQAASLNVVGQVRAGERWAGAELHDGEALEIMTGAPLPAGADTVLMVEHASFDEAARTLTPAPGRTLAAGANVVPQGAEAHAGDVLLRAGRRLGPQQIAMIAGCGEGTVAVEARPRVAIIATGDELTEVDQRPGASAVTLAESGIFNSNGPALGAAVERSGGVADSMAIARDTVDAVRNRIQRARTADLVLLSGGVSMGKYDFVEQVLLAEGAEFFFTGALIQPGKPVVFGRLPKLAPAYGSEAEGARTWTYFFGLPGNPVSTQVTFALFAAPLLRALGGEQAPLPRFSAAVLTAGVDKPAPVTRFLPCVTSRRWDGVTAIIIPWQGSGDQAASARADGFACIPANEVRAAGDVVQVLELV